MSRLLFGDGAGKDKAVQDDGTALVILSRCEHLEVARLHRPGTRRWPDLSVELARTKTRQCNDDTALTMSSRSGHLAVARLLCGAGADMDRRGLGRVICGPGGQ